MATIDFSAADSIPTRAPGSMALSMIASASRAALAAPRQSIRRPRRG